MPDRDHEDRAALRRLGHAIEKRRILGGRTQDELAEAAGVSDRFLRDLESGVGNPSYLTLLAVTRALRVSVADLAADAEP